MSIKRVEFPEVTSAQVNVALVADKLNELILDYNKRFPDLEPDPLNGKPNLVLYPNRIEKPLQLRPGVTLSKSGVYMLNGKFIKKSEAFI